MTRYELCDSINALLDEEGLNLEDKLSVMASMIVGLVKRNLGDPVQQQIHIITLCDTMREYMGIGSHHH